MDVAPDGTVYVAWMDTTEVARSNTRGPIGWVKETVPIWKKEFFEGGEVWVESPEDHALKSATDS